MVPDHFGTTFELIAYGKHKSDQLLAYSCWAGTGARGGCWYAPGAAVQVVGATVYSVWAVRIVHLDIMVQDFPLLFPPPDSAAVYSTPIGDNLY